MTSPSSRAPAALVFLPDRAELFAWDRAASRFCPGIGELFTRGRPHSTDIVTPRGRTEVDGVAVPLREALIELAAIPSAAIPVLSASIAAWALASKLALDLVGRERVVPALVREDGVLHARWAAALSAARDAAQLASLAGAMPPAAHAVPVAGGRRRQVWAPEALLRAFLDAVADTLVRGARGAPPPRARTARGVAGDGYVPWERRWHRALVGADSRFDTEGFAERTLVEDLAGWSRPALGARDQLRACFRLKLPPVDRNLFVLHFLLQSPDDPSLLVAASEVWKRSGRNLSRLGRAFRDPQEVLLEALGRAARLFEPVAASLAEARPSALTLDPAAAWAFLDGGAQRLAAAGFGVIVPAELTRAGQRRLRLRMRVGGDRRVAGAVSGTAGIDLDSLLSFQWEAALGDATLSERQLRALARHKAPLVCHRGEWIAIDPAELAEIEWRLAQPAARISTRQALAAALSGEILHEGVRVPVAAGRRFATLLSRLRDGAGQPAAQPADFRGQLRPYQARGLGWLSTMAELGLGACLADDMGLGKTIQLLAFLLYRRRRTPKDRRPALLVAPTSVLGNWQREAARFAPSLEVVRHHGSERARSAGDVPRRAGTLIVTSYGLLRRDRELLGAVDWSVVALDEAQNIKNAASATARAARSLRASHRFALTGTPVENRLAELWSIFEFANPGLLGPLENFRREYAVPVERYGNREVAERLRRVVSPFLLRRLKSDPNIVRDLPAKHEMKVICTLTQEQATLYQAVLDEEMRRIESADGIERRGRVLALLSFLKQICNHPAQYLGESGPLPGRSGKLARVSEMLEEAVAAGDKALVFTQFREMGERLVTHLSDRLGVEVAFLHGGTPRRARDRMVQRFQEQPFGPRVFVLSVKAGGTGLNLTAANHVFHFDRWWNPAVEDQATDRAHRIGQTRVVQVHKLVCAGTVEEKVDALLERKRDLAGKVVGAGEKWITELGDHELRDLFGLAEDAAVGSDQEDGAETASAEPPRARRRQRRARQEVRS